MKITKELQSILKDNKSGSQDLLLKINRLLLRNIDDKKSLRQIIFNLKKHLLHFQIIESNLVLYERLIAKDELTQLNNFLLRSNSMFQKTYLNIFKQLYSVYSEAELIFTITNSRTVIEALKLWKKKNKDLQVVVCESRPNFEGRITAKELALSSIEVTLIAEALSPMFISKCDLVLIGADKVFKNGNIVNKTGSYSTAIISKYINKPFVVIASKEKITNKIKFVLKKENHKEIFIEKVKGINPINIYFEIVPKELISNMFLA